MPGAPEPPPCRHCGLPLDPEPRRHGAPRVAHPACMGDYRRAMNLAYQRERRRSGPVDPRAARLKWLRIAQEAAANAD